MEMIKAFTDARRVSTPIVKIGTPDATSTMRAITESLGKNSNAPVMYWDVVRGLVGMNKPYGFDEVKRLSGGKTGTALQMATVKPVNMLEMVEKAATDSIIFMNRGHDYWNDSVVRQGIWNLRDPFKMNGVMLTILAGSGATVPEGLRNDIFPLEESLPNAEQLEGIITQVFMDGGLSKPSPKDMDKAVSALIGLSAFIAEQSAAMCLSKFGLDYDMLWEVKRRAIEQTRGLSIWRGGDKFADIGGCENAKARFTRILKGKDSPELVVFIDEIEKQMAGAGTDSSGTKGELLARLLTWMQDHDVTGSLFIGPPGAAKSMLGRAIGNEGKIPTIALDFAGMQSSLVGSSGENLANGLKVIEAISRNRVLFIGTCNSIKELKPELRRRFSLGTFFFDLPTPESRDKIWTGYIKKFGLKDGSRPKDTGWTGAEIFNCCRSSYREGISLKEAAEYIVPVSTSAGEAIRELRADASGNYISAETPGVYQFDPDALESTRKTQPGRMIRVDTSQVGEA